MKKILKYSGFCAALLGIVAFILVMVGTGVYAKQGGLTVSYDAIVLIFGHKETAFGVELVTHAAWTNTVGWIFLLVALIIVLTGIILPLFKVKALDKFAGVLNLVAVCLFVVGGILFFFGKGAFFNANDFGGAENWHLSANVVIGAILAIVAGAFAILPAAVDFIGEKKK